MDNLSAPRRQLPDVLALYPVGSVCLWRYRTWKGRERFIPAQVVGRVPGQGNKRLHLRVLWVQNTPVGNVLFIKDKPQVDATNVISIATWYATRGTNK